MIDHLYSLDYQIEDCFSDSDHDLSHKAPIFPGFEGDNPDSQKAECGTDEDSLCKSVEPLEDSIAPSNHLVFHILMYSLADRMLIEGLKAQAKDKVERVFSQLLDANSFQEAIRRIYNSTPARDRGLRDLAVKKTLEHLMELRTGEDPADLAFPNSLLELVPQFSSDLLVAVMDKTVSAWKKKWSFQKELGLIERSFRLFLKWNRFCELHLHS